jgi:hypothetical protein
MRIADHGFRIVCLAVLAPICLAAQEPMASSPPAESTSAATATPTSAQARSVRISFLPPPLDGTISLGIYDSTGKLVRVLHQQAPLDAFTLGADALVTQWDGKDDDGQDLPPGRYRGRGYLVGMIQVENVPDDPAESVTPANQTKVTIKLVTNPLMKNERPIVELTVGFDDTDSFVKTIDNLPLYVVSKRSDITGIRLAKSGEKSLEVWQDIGAGTEHFRISKLDQMMAFDCGTFDLK